MKSTSVRLVVLFSIFALVFAGVGAAQALGPAPSWQLNQGAADTCSSSVGFFLPGVEINIPTGQASELGVLSAPGFPNLGHTTDSGYGPHVGTVGFVVFANAPYSLPANTPLTLSVTTYFGTNFTGGVSYVSTITWDCTTGALIAAPAPAPTAVAVDVFTGPGLPSPDSRNLVLFDVDTVVLDEPGGLPTGRVMLACQTGFVIETSSGGDYYEIFVMGGWVPVANTQDVPEAYGQPGYPVAPNCVDK